MKKFFLLCLLTSFYFADAQHTATIKGTMHSAEPVKMIYLSYQLPGNTVEDSTALTNGQFAFKAQVPEPTMAYLMVRYAPSKENIKGRFENMPLFLEPGNIIINIKDSLKSADVSGSKSHLEYKRFDALQKPYNDAMQALTPKYMAYRSDNNEAGMKQVEAEADSLNKKVNEEAVKPYLEKNMVSPIALYVLQQYAGYELNPVEIEPLFNQLPDNAKNSTSGKAFKDQIETAKKTAVGAAAMDFTQNDTLDRPVSLSSYKGKYVLIDFWASWCGPCRAENPNVVKAFNQFKDKNFTVLSISLDQPGKKQAWLDAIHKDSLTWTHVSDLKFWDNAVAKQYGITGIPQNLLIDPQGKIIAKNIRGEELQNKLLAMLK